MSDKDDNKRAVPECGDNDSAAANAQPFELDLRSDSLSGETEAVRIVTEELGALTVSTDKPINAGSNTGEANTNAVALKNLNNVPLPAAMNAFVAGYDNTIETRCNFARSINNFNAAVENYSGCTINKGSVTYNITNPPAAPAPPAIIPPANVTNVDKSTHVHYHQHQANVDGRAALSNNEMDILDGRGGEGRLGLENDEGVINNVEPEYGLLRKLVTLRVLNDQNVKFISIDTRDHYEQSRRLLVLITKDNLENFKEALRATKQEHLAAFIEDKLASDPQTRRSPELSILTEDDRQSINNNYDKLVEYISNDEPLDALYANYCITDQHLISIRSKTTKPKRNEEMLDIIKRRSKKDFDKFKEILFQSHGHLRELF